MDALFTTLLSAFLSEIGDRPQILAAALALRYRNDRSVLAGLALATAINCTLAAFGGSAVDRWISEAPLRLFTALAYIFAAIGMLGWRRPVDILGNWTLGPFWTAFLGLFILQFGDKAQFIIAVRAANTPVWPMALIGGWLGIMLACVPSVILKDRMAGLLPIAKIRIAAGAAFLLWGLYNAVGAFGLVT